MIRTPSPFGDMKLVIADLQAHLGTCRQCDAESRTFCSECSIYLMELEVLQHACWEYSKRHALWVLTGTGIGAALYAALHFFL
jgi:hypothetical protein